MRVFLSFSQRDAELARQLEGALRGRHVDTWSELDLGPGADWRHALDNEIAKADGFLFLVGSGASVDSHMQAEWRAILRSDDESKKPLIPIMTKRGPLSDDVPPFLRDRKLIYITDFDEVADQVEHFLRNPAETRDPVRVSMGRADQARRLDELQEFVHALKDDSGGASDPADSR